jgi:hypothetical protein
MILPAMFFLYSPSPAVAQTIDENKESACKVLGNADCTADSPDEEFDTIWDSAINLISFIAGAIAVLMIIIGGLRYVLSAGDANGTAGAKNTIIYAIVGLIIVIVARSIILFVLTRL